MVAIASCAASKSGEIPGSPSIHMHLDVAPAPRLFSPDSEPVYGQATVEPLCFGALVRFPASARGGVGPVEAAHEVELHPVIDLGMVASIPSAPRKARINKPA